MNNNSSPSSLETYFVELFNLGYRPIAVEWDSANKKANHEGGITHSSEYNLEKNLRLIRSGAKGIALKLSSPFGMFDFDLKNTEDKTVFNTWLKSVEAINPDILRKVCIEKTRNNGFHIYIKYRGLDKKIELASSSSGKEVVAVYTGGLLSYTYPTPDYSLFLNEFKDIQELTNEEFEVLCSCGRQSNHQVENKPAITTTKVISKKFKYVYDKILEQELDLTFNYDNWIKLLFAIASEYGESGRPFAHGISQFYPGYIPKETDKKFTSCLNDEDKDEVEEPVTIATFFYLAKLAGIEYPSKKKQQIDFFSDEVYGNLPQPIQEICAQVEDRRKRDVLLIGTITALSAAFSRWRFLHGSGTDIKEYSPHLGSLVVGAAASGKGLIRYGSYLVRPITNMAIKMAIDSKNQYKSQKREFDRKVGEFKKKGQSIEELIEPEKPPKISFAISISDTTQPALVEILHDNPMGCFGYETEIDTMVDGNKKEFGGFGDIIRKVFHHEPLARQRKGEGESYIVEDPRLGFILSGTADQLRKLIPSEYNGLFSRVWYYVIPQVFIPYTVSTQAVDIIGEMCNRLSREIFEKSDLWSGELITLSFTAEQEQELSEHMKDKGDMEARYGGEISASWLRMALIVKRIAVTLSAFQGVDSGAVPEDCWRVAIGLLPTMKHHCIEALNIIRMNKGKKIVLKEDYDQLVKDGLNQSEIAEKLGVSRPTLNNKRKQWGYV